MKLIIDFLLIKIQSDFIKIHLILGLNVKEVSKWLAFVLT